MRRLVASVLGFGLLLGVLTGAAPAAIDIVGDTSNTSGPNPWTGKGNAFDVTTDTTLLQQEFYLSFTGARTITFYVFESPVEFGTYNRIQMNSVAFNGTGAGWYSSGSLNVALDASDYYIMAFSSPGGVASYYYYFDSGDSQAVSFGAQVHGFATGSDPLGSTITSGINDHAIYYQRLTTGVIPEPASLVVWSLLGALGIGVAWWRRRRAA